MRKQHCGIEIDLERDSLFDELGLKRLKDSYMLQSETSPQERFAHVSAAFGTNKEHSQRLYEYASKHWLSYSTPILSFGRTKNGLPISCFLPYVDDTSEGLVNTLSEVNWLSMLGGGVGIYFGIRSASEKSTGVMPHLKIYDASTLAFRQGKCYVAGTEVLTSNGWKKVEELSLEDKIGCIDDQGNFLFDLPLEIVNENYCGKLINFLNKNRGIDFTVTEDHSMVIERKNVKGWSGKLEKVKASLIKKHNEVRFRMAGNATTDKWELTPQEKFAIAFQADGYNNKNNCGCVFHFSKERKIERLRMILDECKYSYSETKNVTTKFYIHKPIFGSKALKDIFVLEDVSPAKANAILEEVAEWDSSRNREYSFMYTSTNEENIDFIQALCVIAGRSSRKTKIIKGGNRKEQFTLFVGNKPYFNLESLETKDIDFDGKVYCCVVKTGKIIVRNDSVPLVCGNTRRGSYASFLDISHPDIMLFLEMRKPTGDQNVRCMNLHHGINITDDFMRIIERCIKDPLADDKWELKDPNSSVVREVVSAKELWQKILEVRIQTGEPYIVFIDSANRALPQHLKDKGLSIKQSNLCVEILEPTNKDRTAVCCLSSLNLEKWEEWKGDEKFISDVVEMLDNVLQYFIDHAPDQISRAKYSAMMERDVGVGALGFHALLQQKMIPFESAQAKGLNIKIFSHIKSKIDEANYRLGKERGEAPDAAGTGKRLSLTSAIAPNASSSIFMGNTSPSIEPFKANAYRQDTLSGSFLNKNIYLDRIIKQECEKNKNLDYGEVWSSIISNAGSVAHLDFLDDWTKSVFKTAIEIDQRWLVEHAADRQEFIDQSQSLNLFFRPDTSVKYLHACHFLAWKKGLKTLYYCRSEKIMQTDKVSQKIERKIIEEIDLKNITEDECLACSG